MLRYFRVTDHISPSPSHNQKPHYVRRTVSLHTSEVQHMNYRLYFWKNGTFEKSSSQEQSMCIVPAERNNPWTTGSPHILQGNYLAGDTHVILQVCIYLLVFSAYTLLLLVLFFFLLNMWMLLRKLTVLRDSDWLWLIPSWKEKAMCNRSRWTIWKLPIIAFLNLICHR